MSTPEHAAHPGGALAGRPAIALALCLAALGCSPAESGPRDAMAVAAQASAPAATASAANQPAATAPAAPTDTSHRLRPGYVVDSILPVEEELRRFTAGLGAAPRTLSGGASSRESLVLRFFSALAASDTAALRAMVLSKSEFAHLVYPSSPHTRPPYRQAPAIVWMRLRASSASGLVRLLDRARGFRYVRHECLATPRREGRNSLWRQCRAVVVRDAGDTARVRLFGVVVERDGHFKFASLETDF